jgi:hypothetical protein
VPTHGGLTGQHRDEQKPARFDKEYPIDIDKPLDFVTEGNHKLVDLLADVKKGLPYVFRYWAGKEGEQEDLGAAPSNIREVSVAISESSITMRELLSTVVRALPGWQATVFPGRIILYLGTRHYPLATVQFPKEGRD